MVTRPPASLHAALMSLVPLVAVGGGCDRYEPPCDVVSQSAVLEGLAAEAELEPLPNGSVVIRWLRYDPAPGADPWVQPVPAGLEVAVVDPDGFVTERTVVASPRELSERKGSTHDVGAVWTPERTVFHWVEESLASAPDGAQTTASRLVVGFGGGDGTVGASPFTVECDDCVLHAAAVRFPAGVSVLFSHRPRHGALAAEGAALEVGFVLASPDGSFTSGKVPWLAALSSSGSSASGVGSSPFAGVGAHPELRGVAGTPLVLTQAHGVWAVDAWLQPVAGPLLLTDAAVATLEWNVASNRVATASTHAHEGNVGEEPDLRFRVFDNDGVPLGGPQRFSTGLTARALASSDSGYGVVFASRTTQYFALLDSSGVKVGGDLRLSSQPVASAQSPGTLGGPPRATESLTPRSGRGYVRLAIEQSRAVRTEIVCAR